MTKKERIEKWGLYAKDKGCELLSKNYERYNDYLLFRCSCGEVFERQFYDFQDTPWCKKCVSKNRKKRWIIFRKKMTEKLKREYRDQGCEFLDFYKGSLKKLKYRCSCGKIHYSLYHSWKSGSRCPECGKNKITRENHYKWDTTKTSKDREGRKLNPEYKIWAGNVNRRDNYTCQICNAKRSQIKYREIKISAHHINGFNWFKEGRFEVSNGITLCRKCHKDFHSIYGMGDNTKEQLKEFFTKHEVEFPSVKYLTTIQKPSYDKIYKYTIDEIKEKAKLFGLKLISNTYVNQRTPLLWECKCGCKIKKDFATVLYCNHNRYCDDCKKKLKKEFGNKMYKNLFVVK